jgi:hypothetical protein
METMEVKTGLMTGEQLETILNRVENAHRDDIVAWRKRMMEEHEDNFIMVDGYTAVLDISTARVDLWDGCNGYYELTPEQYVEVMAGFGENVVLDDATMMTKQGLTKRYRFLVVLNEVVGEDTYQYRIVKTDSIQKSNTVGSMISQNQSIEMRMRRADV